MSGDINQEGIFDFFVITKTVQESTTLVSSLHAQQWLRPNSSPASLRPSIPHRIYQIHCDHHLLIAFFIPNHYLQILTKRILANIIGLYTMFSGPTREWHDLLLEEQAG